LTVKEKTSVTIKMRHDLTPPNSIGFYILSSVNGIVSHTIIIAITTIIYTSTHRLIASAGGRPLLAKKEVLVAKSGFWEAPEGTCSSSP
jgi:hypothetical protein